MRRDELDESETSGLAPASGRAPPAQRQQAPVTQRSSEQIAVDDSQAASGYANFCRFTGTPEELLVDFGINTQSSGTTTQSVQVTQRVVMSYHTAKRLLHALHLTVQRHEAVFGLLETDVQKRLGRS
jgi:hypothetical protein